MTEKAPTVPFEERMETLNRVIVDVMAAAQKASSKDEAITLLKNVHCNLN